MTTSTKTHATPPLSSVSRDPDPTRLRHPSQILSTHNHSNRATPRTATQCRTRSSLLFFSCFCPVVCARLLSELVSERSPSHKYLLHTQFIRARPHHASSSSPSPLPSFCRLLFGIAPPPPPPIPAHEPPIAFIPPPPPPPMPHPPQP